MRERGAGPSGRGTRGGGWERGGGSGLTDAGEDEDDDEGVEDGEEGEGEGGEDLAEGAEAAEEAEHAEGAHDADDARGGAGEDVGHERHDDDEGVDPVPAPPPPPPPLASSRVLLLLMPLKKSQTFKRRASHQPSESRGQNQLPKVQTPSSTVKKTV